MQPGTYISGAGHLALIGWAMLAGVFQSPPSPVITTANVSVMTGEEFAALTNQPVETPPAAISEQPQAPETPDQAESPATPAPDTAPEVAATPEATETPPPDEAPDVSEVQPIPRAEVSPEAPETPDPPDAVPGASLVLDNNETPKPRPVPRIAPEAAPEPSPEAEIADTVQEATRPDDSAQAPDPVEAQPETAPEAAATETVTEAEEEAGGTQISTLAPATSRRPPQRPNRPAPTPAAQPADETPADEEPVAQNDLEPDAPPSDAINDALEEALAGGGSDTEATVPSGPPMSRGEKDALRVSVQRCWNVGSLSSEALRVTVVVGVSMQQNGQIVQGSIRQIEATGGSGAATRQAFEAARRAIIRCGSDGFPLPPEKYSQWREIEMVFNPEGMRLR